ncbi:MAG: DUF4982 domain-containing protein [Prevotella sp.]|nr:DUF4982 domain-containing protein [Prevotella sp.]
MRKMLLMVALAMGLTTSAQYQEVKERKTDGNRPLAEFAAEKNVLFNCGWKFQLVTKDNKTTDFASPQLDDSQWRTLDLPHDFQFEQPWTEGGGGARGFKPSCEGWYRKTFTVPESWQGLNVKLDFGGIIYLGDVYINGTKVASTDYGYVGLEADLTKHLRYGGENVVAVYASTGPKKGSRWYTGAGLFRDVRLQLDNPTHIARHGVYITCEVDELTSKQVDELSASGVRSEELGTRQLVNSSTSKINIQVEVDGWQKRKNVSIRARVIDAEGNVVGKATGTMPKYTKQTSTEVMLTTVNIADAKLWDIDSPYLYSADVVVEADGMVVDSVREQFGIRKIEFSKDFGFKLNGRKVFLKGISNHHDMGALGAAAFDDGIERMMRRLKEFGFNHIRCSHNPYSESFTKIADRVGLLIVDELIDKWSDNDYWGGRRPFTSMWPQMITEWVKRDRNSPSVIMWSLGNELQIREGWAGYQGLNDWGVTMYRVMDQVVKRWDKTRKTTVGQYPARAGAIAKKDRDFNKYLVPPEMAQATEVASLNYQSDKYAAYLEHCPEMIIYQSEAETSAWLAPYYNMDHERMVGMAYWGAIEYWGESNRWPKKGWNYSFFDHTCRPLPQAWLAKSAFCEDEPVVRIGVLDTQGSETVNWNDVNVGQTALLDHWNHAANSKQQIYTFTNAHAVELIVNGKSIGTKENNGTGNMRNAILWKDIDYGKGGSIVAIARSKDGKETARHEMQTAGKAVRLVVNEERRMKNEEFATAINEERNLLRSEGVQECRSADNSMASTPSSLFSHLSSNSLIYLNITATDSKGRIVPGYNEPMTATVEGGATLYALDNHDHYTSELFHNVNTKNMKNGRMQVILRRSNKPGKIVLKVATPSFKKKITIF